MSRLAQVSLARLRYHRLRVTLRAPVAGRRIVRRRATSPILDALAEIRIEGTNRSSLSYPARHRPGAAGRRARPPPAASFMAYAAARPGAVRGVRRSPSSSRSAGIAVGRPGGRVRVRLSSDLNTRQVQGRRGWAAPARLHLGTYTVLMF